MLRKETVTAETLELLKRLMQDEHFGSFFLVGGTALSLQIGHRISVDIDLFSVAPFDENELLIHLETYEGFQLNYIDKRTIKGQVNMVQVDFITHRYPLARPVVVEEEIRMACLEDIAAMKLNAIIVNGTRLKDFVDIAFMSSYLSLNQIVEVYEEKYETRNPVITLKALSYYDDINYDEPIRFTRGSYRWELIENRINEMIQSPGQIFQSSPF